MTGLVLLAADQQLPEDVGKAGPIGALLTVLLFIAILLLVKSMTTHLKRVPRSFDHGAAGPAGVRGPAPGRRPAGRLGGLTGRPPPVRATSGAPRRSPAVGCRRSSASRRC